MKDGECQGGTAQGPRQPGHAHGRLAEGALAVERAFAGQAEVGPVEPAPQVHRLDHEVDPALEPTAGEGDQAPAQASRRARARQVANRHVQVALDDVREVGEVAVERLDHRRHPPLSAVRTRPRPPPARRADW